MMEESNQNTGESIQNVEALQPAASLGSVLRKAREALGLSVGDVANQIKFAPRQIEALEADDFSAKPESTFLRGFVRSYGRLLHLDEATLFALLPEIKMNTLSAAPVPNQTIFPTAQSNLRKHNLIWMSGALLLVAIAIGFAITSNDSSVEPKAEVGGETQMSDQAQTSGAVLESPVVLPSDMQAVTQQSPAQVEIASAVAAVTVTTPIAVEVVKPVVLKVEEKTVAQQVEVKPVEPLVTAPKKPKVVEKPKQELTPQPVSPVTKIESPKEVVPIDMLLGITPAKPTNKPTEASNTASQNTALRIVFGEESWAEVRDGSGKSLSSKINASGSELNLMGSPPFNLSIAHAKSARLYYKGKQVDLNRYIKKYSTSEVANVKLE
ncbi:MAG: RodZ domain-containing protein [Gallionella sp.]